MPDPLVAHAHHRRLALAPHREAHLPSVRRVLDRVRDEVLHHLGEPVAVGPAGQGLVGHVEHERVRGVGREVRPPPRAGGRRGRPAGSRRRTARSRGGSSSSVLSTRLAMCVAARMMDRACSTPLVGGASSRPLQQLRPAQDRGQGRAEVVGHDVHELALHPVELHEPGVRFLQRLVELGVAQDDADPVGERLERDDLPAVEVARPRRSRRRAPRRPRPRRGSAPRPRCGPRRPGGRSRPRLPPPPPCGARAAPARPVPPPWRRPPSSRREGPGPRRRPPGRNPPPAPAWRPGQGRKASWMRWTAVSRMRSRDRHRRRLAQHGVDERELLAALALRGEGHRVRHRDRELAGEAGQVLEVVVGEGQATPGRRVALRTP